MFQAIKKIIDEGSRFLVTTHIDPDGDALGSVFALAFVLESMGKDVWIYLKDPIPYRYQALPRPEKISGSIPAGPFDGLFVLDCGSLFRVGEGYEALKDIVTIVSVDHHATNDAYGTVNVLDEDASSTAEIIHGLVEFLGVEMSLSVAENIYTGIFTDTGSFRYENTNPKAFLICEKMMRAGVQPSRVARMVHENHPKERFLLLGLVLNTLESFDHDRVAMAQVTREMFQKTDTTREHTDGFVEYIREIRGVEVAIMVRELSEGRYKISMRSKGQVDVADVCNRFGGGGHRNAAGCQIEGSMEHVKIKLREALGV